MALELVRAETPRGRFLAMVKMVKEHIGGGRTNPRVKRGVPLLHFISNEELREFHGICGFMLGQAEFEIDRRSKKAGKR